MLCTANAVTARAAPIRAASASSDVSASHRRSPYEVLRVNRDASQLEIKTAYRTLAKLYHPDARSRFMDSTAPSISPPAAEDPHCFVEINRAYATLSDPYTRKVYDDDGTNLATRSTPAGFRRPVRPTRRWETDQCW